MYKFYVNENKKQVIAVTHYAGHTVKGIATCSDEDEFDLEIGKEIAKLKCDFKVACKRNKNAVAKYKAAAKAADDAQKHYDDMKQYYIDSIDAADNISQQHQQILEKLKNKIN